MLQFTFLKINFELVHYVAYIWNMYIVQQSLIVMRFGVECRSLRQKEQAVLFLRLF